MTRALRPLALAILLLAACASLWPVVVAGDAPSLAPRITIALAPEDSLVVRVQWQASRAQRGASVDHYVWSVHVDGSAIATGTTADLHASAIIERPMPGDTALIHAQVYAIDSRGTSGEVAVSDAIEYYEPVAGPTAPIIVDLDTIPVAIGFADSLRMVFPASHIEDGVLVLDVDETVQGCVVAWEGERAFRPADQPAECLQGVYPAGLFRGARGVVVRQAD